MTEPWEPTAPSFEEDLGQFNLDEIAQGGTYGQIDSSSASDELAAEELTPSSGEIPQEQLWMKSLAPPDEGHVDQVHEGRYVVDGSQRLRHEGVDDPTPLGHANQYPPQPGPVETDIQSRNTYPPADQYTQQYPLTGQPHLQPPHLPQHPQAPQHLQHPQDLYQPAYNHYHPQGFSQSPSHPDQRYHSHTPHRPKHRRPRNRAPTDQQRIQVVAAPNQNSPSMSDQMQMMMMNQMMMQQMAAQQMQVAQMAALTKDTSVKEKKAKRPKVDIKSRHRGSRRPRFPPVIPVVVPQQPVVAGTNTIESAMMENWQEATIILCIAIVGLIYLVVSRNTKEEVKEATLAAKHLVPKT